MRKKQSESGRKSNPSSVAAAKVLRREIMALPDGTRLGIEGDMLARLGISRPTFRETARMLEREQILTIRTGPHGGYFTRRPTFSAVSQVAATFLEFENTSMMDLMNVANALMTEAARLAAVNINSSEAKRKRLAGAVQRLKKDPADDHTKYSAADGEFVMAVLGLANNPAISLFVRSLYNFGFAEASRRVFSGKPDRIETRRQSRIDLGEAILAGEARRAVTLSDDQYEIARHWLDEARASAYRGKR